MRRLVLLWALAVLPLEAVSCQGATPGELESAVTQSPTHVISTLTTVSPAITGTPISTRTRTPTATPSPTSQATLTPTLSPTLPPTSTPTPLPPAPTTIPSPGSDCPPDAGCLRIENQCAGALVFQLIGEGVEQEVSIDAGSATTMHLPAGQHAYRALVEVFGCMSGGQGLQDRYCTRLNTDYRDTVIVENGLTSRLVFTVTCQQWDGSDCMDPTLTLLELSEPAPAATLPGPPTATATPTAACECAPNLACLRAENLVGDQLIIEIRGANIAQDFQVEPNSQATVELPHGQYEYLAHTKTGYRVHRYGDNIYIGRASAVYLAGTLDAAAGACHRLAFSVSCGWWDQGRCFDPVLVLAD